MCKGIATLVVSDIACSHHDVKQLRSWGFRREGRRWLSGNRLRFGVQLMATPLPRCAEFGLEMRAGDRSVRSCTATSCGQSLIRDGPWFKRSIEQLRGNAASTTKPVMQ